MRTQRNLLALRAPALVVLAFAAIPVLAQSPSAPVSPDWGTAAEISYYVGAAAFHGATQNVWVVATGEGVAYLTDVSSYAWAPVYLPQGALITGFDFYFADWDVTYGITCGLREISSTGTSTVIGDFIQSTGSAGWGTISHNLAPPYFTANNSSNGYQALVSIGSTGTPANLTWSGVRIRYKLQVSPAPGVASFSDVPTGHWAFQWIEALKASGITQGVTPTTYEPESNVTRAQMAVFLAKALGLHWPN